MNIRPLHTQQGATLFVALIMLLIITVLALSGARETTLETRITGNLVEQQQLLNDAEAALREGERRLTIGIRPLEPACSADYCLHDDEQLQLTNDQDFSEGALTYSLGGGNNTQWYAVPALSGATEDQSENPEYGNMLMGIGTFRYEVNATSSSSTEQQANLRSTTAKVFN